MAPSSRKCIFPGCQNLPNSSVTLFKFPKNDELKKRWIDFVKCHGGGELRITTNTRLCSEHFTPASFTNFHRRQLGFTDNPLLLVNGAAPTVSLPGLHPPAPPTPAAIVGGTSPPSLPATRETACQCDNMQKVTREVGCQTERFVGKRTVATQLSERTLSSRKNTVLPPELQPLSVCKEELPPEQQEWSPSLVQEEPGPPHIKEEEEEFPVKTEHDEDCAQWSQLHQSQSEEKREAEAVACTSTEPMETEADGEDWGVSEAASSSDPAAALQPAGAEQLFSSHRSEPETEDSDGGWKETRQPQSVLPPELQPLSVCKEELPPEQQEWSPSLVQEEPGPPHIKEEEEEFPVKTEHDEDCAQWSRLHQSQSEEKREAEAVACTSTEQMETDADGEDWGVSEAASSSDPAAALQPAGAEQLFPSHRSEPETEDSDGGWKETRQPQSGYHRKHPTYLTTRVDVKVHQRGHTEEKPYPCEQCVKRFSQLGHLKLHECVHTREKPYPCEQCGKRFRKSAYLKRHQRMHTQEKQYTCEQCQKHFTQSAHLKIHQCTHRRETIHL